MRPIAPVLAALALLAGCSDEDGGRSAPTLAPTVELGEPDPLPTARRLAGARGRLEVRAEIDGRTVVFGFVGRQKVALVLRYDGIRWRRLPRRGVTVRPLGPDPGSTHPPIALQVAAELTASSAITDAGMWLDGRAFPATPVGTPRRYTVYGPSPTLKRGVHTVAAFASTGTAAHARIWTFRVR